MIKLKPFIPQILATFLFSCVVEVGNPETKGVINIKLLTFAEDYSKHFLFEVDKLSLVSKDGVKTDLSVSERIDLFNNSGEDTVLSSGESVSTGDYQTINLSLRGESIDFVDKDGNGQLLDITNENREVQVAQNFTLTKDNETTIYLYLDPFRSILKQKDGSVKFSAATLSFQNKSEFLIQGKWSEDFLKTDGSDLPTWFCIYDAKHPDAHMYKKGLQLTANPEEDSEPAETEIDPRDVDEFVYDPYSPSETKTMIEKCQGAVNIFPGLSDSFTFYGLANIEYVLRIYDDQGKIRHFNFTVDENRKIRIEGKD